VKRGTANEQSSTISFVKEASLKMITQGPYGHGKPGKVMAFLNGYFQAWKNHGKNVNHQSFGKVKEICYNHMFIYAELMCFLKKDAQNISRRTLSIRNTFYIFHVYTEISVWSWTFGLTCWKSTGQHV